MRRGDPRTRQSTPKKGGAERPGSGIHPFTVILNSCCQNFHILVGRRRQRHHLIPGKCLPLSDLRRGLVAEFCKPRLVEGGREGLFVLDDLVLDQNRELVV